MECSVGKQKMLIFFSIAVALKYLIKHYFSALMLGNSELTVLL